MILRPVALDPRQEDAVFRCKRAFVQVEPGCPKGADCLLEIDGGVAHGRGGIIQLMRQTGGQFSQSHELFALLVGLGRFADAVGHYAHQLWSQRRRALHHLREVRDVQKCDRSRNHRARR